MGKSIAERKAELAREIAELEILENQENIRNEIAKKIELKERLFISLKDQPTVCRMPINSDARFKVVYQSDICVKDQCFFSATCSEIAALNGKKGKRKSSTGTSAKVATETFKYKVSGNYPNVIVNIIESPLGKESFSLSTVNCKGFRKVLTDMFKPVGITGNQVSGLTKILNKKGFTLK